MTLEREPVRFGRNLRRGVGLLLLAGACGLVLTDFAREFNAVDRCLDAGQVYDYQEERCRDDVIHRPRLAYAARRPVLLGTAGVMAMLGLGLVLLGRRSP